MEYVLYAAVMFAVLGAALLFTIAWAAITDPSDRDEEWVRSFQPRHAVHVRSHHRH